MKDRTITQAKNKVATIVEKLKLANISPEVIGIVKSELEKKIQALSVMQTVSGEKLERIFLEYKPLIPLTHYKSEQGFADQQAAQSAILVALKETAQSVKEENLAMEKAHALYLSLQTRVRPDGHLVKIPGLAVLKINEIIENLRANGTPDKILILIRRNLISQVRSEYAGFHLQSIKLEDVILHLNPKAGLTYHELPQVRGNIQHLLKTVAKSIGNHKPTEPPLPPLVVGEPLMDTPFQSLGYALFGFVSLDDMPYSELENKLMSLQKEIIGLKEKIKQPPYTYLDKYVDSINEKMQLYKEIENRLTLIRDQNHLWQYMQEQGWDSADAFTWENVQTLFIHSNEVPKPAESLDVIGIGRTSLDKLSNALYAEDVHVTANALFSLVDIAPAIMYTVKSLKKEGVSPTTIANILESISKTVQSGKSIVEVVKQFSGQLPPSATESLLLSLKGLGTAVAVIGVIQGALHTAQSGYALYQDIVARAEIGNRARVTSVAADLVPMLATIMNAMPNKTSSEALKKTLVGDWKFNALLPFDKQRERFIKLYKANPIEYLKKAQEGKLGLFELKMIQGLLANEQGRFIEKILFEEAERSKLKELDKVLQRGLTAQDPGLKDEYLRSIYALGATIQLATQGSEVKSEATKQVLRSASLTMLNAASVSCAVIALAGVTSPAVAAGGFALGVAKKAVETFTEDKAEKIKEMIEKMAPSEVKVLLDQVIVGGRETAALQLELLQVKTVDALIEKRTQFISDLIQKKLDNPPLPDFRDFDERWDFIDKCINKLQMIAQGVKDGSLDDAEIQPEREQIVKSLLAAQDLTSEQTFDQAAATHLRQPFCDAMAKAIEQMYSSNLNEHNRLIIDMLKRELSRINMVLPLAEDPSKIKSMMMVYAKSLGVLNDFKNAIDHSKITARHLHNSQSQVSVQLEKFREATQSPKEKSEQISTEQQISFDLNKAKIQENFISHLDTLKRKLSSYPQDSDIYKEGKKLYSNLFAAQREFFQKLSPEASKDDINTYITDFRQACRVNVKTADKVMGYGWLYRTAEVTIKGVVGLFAGIGMVLGSLVGQGVLKAEHRQKFKETFLTFNQTDSSKELEKFKQVVLGEKETEGLISESNFNVKK